MSVTARDAARENGFCCVTITLAVRPAAVRRSSMAIRRTLMSSIEPQTNCHTQSQPSYPLDLPLARDVLAPFSGLARGAVCASVSREHSAIRRTTSLPCHRPASSLLRTKARYVFALGGDGRLCLR